MKTASRIYTGLVMLFLFAPIAILLVFSFNDSKSLSVFSDFSFRWYRELFRDSDTLGAVRNTLILAVSAALISTALAVIIFLAWKRVSLVSVLTGLTYLAGTILMQRLGYAHPYLLYFVAPVVALILIRHKDNIKRLIRGEEKAITPKDRS